MIDFQSGLLLSNTVLGERSTRGFSLIVSRTYLDNLYDFRPTPESLDPNKKLLFLEVVLRSLMALIKSMS